MTEGKSLNGLYKGTVITCFSSLRVKVLHEPIFCCFFDLYLGLGICVSYIQKELLCFIDKNAGSCV